MNSIESRLNTLLEEFIAFDVIIVEKDKLQREIHSKLVAKDYGDSGPDELVKEFTKNNMELTELSMSVDKVLECIKEVYNLAKLGNPDFKVDEKYSTIVEVAVRNVLSNFGVVNGKVVIVNPDYERLLNEHLQTSLTPERITSILNSNIFKAS